MYVLQHLLKDSDILCGAYDDQSMAANTEVDELDNDAWNRALTQYSS